MIRPPPRSTLFPSTPLSRSQCLFIPPTACGDRVLHRMALPLFVDGGRRVTGRMGSTKRSGLRALNEQIRVEGAGPKPPPRSEDTECLQVGVLRHAYCDCSRHGP